MRELFRLIPRKYRTAAVRLSALVLCVVLICLFATPDTPKTGAGKTDKSLFRFDYDVTENEDGETILAGYEEQIQEEHAVAPAKHRGEDFEKLAESHEEPSNFTEPPLLKPDVVEYYTKEELQPWFDRPHFNPSDPGELGKPVKVDEKNEDLKAKIKEGWEKHAFNNYVCDQISLHRSLGDRRDKECIERKWRKPIPTTSVIIIFHNEAWCTLIRTIHSVLENSPKIALKEIIVVDDASTLLDELGTQLEEYIIPLKIVTLLRMKTRQGLVQARLAGAKEATGDVLTFLDSHCECAPHWLEPLLERIAEDPTRVVSPVIETIDADTFAMSFTPARSVKRGILTWSLTFNWGERREGARRVVNDQVVLSPTMAGGLFAISKKYFYHLGSYDDKMMVWGGENIEMSIRIWTCGGSLEIHPCSHVGHVFRTRAPYTHPGGLNVITKNKNRVAEVWMDVYKKHYYKRNPGAEKVGFGDVRERVELRKRLKCHNFEWYLTNVYPELHVVKEKDIIKEGEWHNLQASHQGSYDKCLDSNNEGGRVGIKVSLINCHGGGGNQDFMLTKQGEIRQDHARLLCLQPHGSIVITVPCVPNGAPIPYAQRWTLTMLEQLKHMTTNRCVEARPNNEVILLPCRDVESQKWIVEKLS